MPEPTPRNPNFAADVRTSFAKQGLMHLYGASLTTISPGAVDIEVSFRPDLSQQHGLFHGGVTTALTDSACGYAALTIMDPGSEVLTVNFSINLMAPAQGARLVARGRVVRSGRSITVCRGDTYAIDGDGRETHCATMTATMMRMDATAPESSTGSSR